MTTPVLTSKRLVAEACGTALLVFFAVGVATLTFGVGTTGSSVAAGVATTAFAFGLVVVALAYALGPLSGAHVNPAVTMGFLLSRRMDLKEAAGYWVAQVVGGIVGALALWGVLSASTTYDRSTMGLGQDGFGKASLIGLNATGAFVVETIMTFLFVFVVLSVTRRAATPVVSGLVIGLALTTVHLIGIPLTGTSVNPARSIGPALIVGDLALSQRWLFIVAPLVGGAVAALAHEYFYPLAQDRPEEIVMPDVVAQRMSTSMPTSTTETTRT
jgi:aquaporin Z